MSDASEPVLTWSQYGKAEVRVVHVDRSTPRHVIRDLNVSSALRGAFDAAYTDGDNTGVLTTDAQKNTVFGLARETGVGEPEDFAVALAHQLLSACPAAEGVLVDVQEFPWARIGGHDHAFFRSGSQVRTARLDTTRDGTRELSGGLEDLVVLKTTGSEYKGFLVERFTTLAETDERILATQVTASWRYTDDVARAAGAPGGPDFAAVTAGVQEALVTTFADLHSLALQQTLHAMAGAALAAHPEIESVTLRMPNKHHFLQDLSRFGLDNPDAVYHADDRPYGLIEGTISRR